MRFLLTMLFLVPLCAQETPPAGAKQGGRGPQPPRNLKVLKVPPTDIRSTMGAFRVALGVQCNYCHVQGDFAADDNPKKEIARKMIVMAQDVNGRFPDGKEHVTCYTCHRGEATPKTAPPPPAPPGQ